MNTSNHSNVLIVGGGCAGISVATRIKKLKSDLTITVIEPSDKAYYQAAWTLVGAGAYDVEKTIQNMSSVMPSYVNWVKAYAKTFLPESNTVKTDSGDYTYDYLVVCPGIKLNWKGIEGLEAALGSNNVCSNYDPDMAVYTWKSLQNFKRGTALFTEPPMPIKCAGAPQKILYLAADHLKRQGILGDCNLEFFCAKPVIFGVPYFQKPLNDVCDFYGLKRNFQHNLISINGNAKEAVFKQTDASGATKEVVRKFDFIHVTPPQSSPEFIKNSPLADAAGWVDVDHKNGTLKHTKFPNIYSLGDVMNAPNAKTGAAVRKQAPIVAHNLIKDITKASYDYRSYDGYGACPLTVAYGKVMLAEFCYNGVVTPSFPMDPREPRALYWHLKSKLFPFLQWNVMFKGNDWNIPRHTPIVSQHKSA
jgi:sulfide:quinone oxidoreductase